MSVVEVISTSATLDITIFNKSFSVEIDYEFRYYCVEYYLPSDTK